MHSTFTRWFAISSLLLSLGACDDEPVELTDDSDEEPQTDAPDSWDNFADAFMQSYCVECHSTSPKDFSQLADMKAFAETVRCGVASTTADGCSGWPPARQFPVGNGAMPSDEERDRLTAWIDAGML